MLSVPSSDGPIFRHAGKCGVKILDGVKVKSIQFNETSGIDVLEDRKVANAGRLVSATWKRKDSTIGSIKFDYLLDVNERVSSVFTRYMKNRSYKKGLL